jgi:hypothetical protein
MKVGIIGAGAVGAATGLALIGRQVCRYAAPLTPAVELNAVGYDLLTGADVVISTAGVNERAGGAVGRCRETVDPYPTIGSCFDCYAMATVLLPKMLLKFGV